MCNTKRLALFLLSLAAVFAAAALWTPTAAAQVNTPHKVYVVDFSKIMQNSSVVKQARERLGREFGGERSKELEKLEGELKGLLEDLKKQSAILSASAREKKEEQLLTKRKEYSRQRADLEGELKREAEKMNSLLYEKLRSAVHSLAEERGYGFILEQRQRFVLFASSHLDISDEVIKLIDKGEPLK